jgi:GT2 family glycosyltransferase
MSELPWVVVTVLNWNGRDDTLACLDSLQDVCYPNYRVIVVDNGSSDGSVAAIHHRFPDQTVIETGENLGFAGGNNVGLRYARECGADYALLLNNDTEVTPDFLSLLVDAIDEDPSIAVVGPTICYRDPADVIWSAGGGIDWKRGSSHMIGLDQREDDAEWTLREVDFVSGCALLVRLSALDEAGYLDERFFAYYEETEWCVRIHRTGYRILHVPEAKIWHKIPFQDGRAQSPIVHYYMKRNRLLFLKATGVGIGAWIHTLLMEYARTLSSWTLRPKWRGKRAQRRAMVWAIADACRGKWGKLTRSFDVGV